MTQDDKTAMADLAGAVRDLVEEIREARQEGARQLEVELGAGEVLDSVRRQHEAELARVRAEHAREVAALQAEVVQLASGLDAEQILRRAVELCRNPGHISSGIWIRERDIVGGESQYEVRAQGAFGEAEATSFTILGALGQLLVEAREKARQRRDVLDAQLRSAT